MARDLGSEVLAYGFLDLIDLWIGEFPNLLALIAHMVIMMLVGEGLFVQCYFVFKLMLDSQSTLDQKIQGIVNGRSTDCIAFVSHF